MTSMVAPQSGSRSNSHADNVAISSGSDLRATISLVEDLAARAEASISSVCAFLRGSSDFSFSDKGFCCCPFDSRHRMPPESLFRHWLRCTSAPGGPILDLGFLETMRYPSTFKSEEELRRENHFVRPLPEAGADLCFSLEKELEDVGASRFFYKDCPGVVTYPEPDVSARTFSLPRVLAMECANFISGDRSTEDEISQRRSTLIFPSKIWAFRKEVEAWRNYPERYSYIAAQVASCLREVTDFGLKQWILSSSPRFGIVIDTAMSDHIYLLLKLCLKSVRREALSFLYHLDPTSLQLMCPCLSEALTWLASQLSILYGEINGKNLAISMIAESLKRVASCFLSDESSSSAGIHAEEELLKPCAAQIHVTQIAAAVAALHERSMLEDMMNKLRFPQPSSRDLLLHELSIVSARAHEERARRPNYRPILEYDGFLLKKSQNQDTMRTKTREEMLAEERDYKRRRTSYRGKKVKRTAIQVMRDVIEDHMGEITEAGRIGKSADTENSSHPTADKRTPVLEFDMAADMAGDFHHRERNSTKRLSTEERRDYEYVASRDQRSYYHQRKQVEEARERKYDRRPSFHSNSPKDHSDRSSLSSSYASNEGFSNMSERRKQTRERKREPSVSGIAFEDRYDPFEAS